MERISNLHEQEKEHAIYRGVVTSRGVELGYRIGQNSITVDDGLSSLSYIMSHEQLDFVKFLSQHPDQDYLESDLRPEIPSLEGHKIIDVYRNATKALGVNPIRDNFIKFGIGKSSRYAHLRNSEDCSLIVRRGIESIDVNRKYEELRNRELRSMSYAEVRLLRQLKPYIRLEKAYSKEEGLHKTRNKIIGATVLSTVTIGGTLYYIHKK